MRVLFLVTAFAVFADPREFIVLKAEAGIGLFGSFNQVLALVKLYDQGYYRGIEVDFGKQGLYYDPKHGDNWWNYYCEPISIGEKIEVREVAGDVPFARRREAEWYTDRQEGHALIQKYIQFKPHILQKVETFERMHFQGHVVIGVHFRGTDKLEKEASFITHSEVFRQVQELVRPLILKRIQYKVFLATDEQKMVDFMKSVFSTHLCYQSNALRAKKGDLPPHFNQAYDRYLCGEEAVVDCLLLSKCDLLVRTSSNLSLWSMYLNPQLPVIELNRRIDDEKPSIDSSLDESSEKK